MHLKLDHVIVLFVVVLEIRYPYLELARFVEETHAHRPTHTHAYTETLCKFRLHGHFCGIRIQIQIMILQRSEYEVLLSFFKFSLTNQTKPNLKSINTRTINEQKNWIYRMACADETHQHSGQPRTV